ncbi:cyclic beta 1-2 glucan synthetase [Deltaproteobacteria bacterium]|nr:cyclic beta 1-2 glucan synthetase [Deltaproteobacteria bacterium]
MYIVFRTLRAVFPRILARFYPNRRAFPSDAPSDEQPFCPELLSAEQRAQHSRMLAGTHRLRPGRSRNRLLARLAENERALFAVHTLLVKDIEADLPITPAGEWLLDNFYVIEEQIRTARRHLPKGYSEELPHLLNTLSAGLPRVYDISLAAISYGDGRMDPESLRDMVAAYQSVTILNLGELWAIPIMLRLALTDKLQKVAGMIAAARKERIRANNWADQMIKVAAEKPEKLILSIADMARSTPSLTSAFVAELMRRLRGMGPALALPLTWVEQRLSENELTIEQLVRAENQLQAANQISMSNCIGSLRTLDVINWRDFVESMSHVEQALALDPACAYGAMDFTTRDRYRHVVEKLAKNSLYSETAIARKAVELAQEATLRPAVDTRSTHVGYYLIDAGLPQLEQSIQASVPLPIAPQRFCRKIAFTLYGGGIILLTGLFTAAFLAQAHGGGAPEWALYALAPFAFLGSSHLAFALANWLATLLVNPRPLPRLDFSKGIPESLRTLVVIPTLLQSEHDTENLVTNLEIRFLANRDKHLHFALLTDFADADKETLPEDEALLQTAQEKIEALNDKYKDAFGDSFFLFHRPRLWNRQEHLWMGQERKRGKLADLNNFLRGGARGKFSRIVGDAAALLTVKYVITLDADTQLARDSARKFVGTMAHPLNQARYDQDKQRVVAGYGILQPRVTPSLAGGNRSRYARLCSSDTGIDPYTRATSDVYQDLFGEGSFIGKGIYDVDIFERALGGQLPANRILSHDLLEGCYARSGLLSDVQLYEDYPARYSMDAARRRRWIRGDWQIARWALPRIPGPDGRSRPNPLSALSRWKILDNLRRSLVAASLLCLLALGWIVSSSPLFWSLAVIGIILAPPLLFSTFSLFRKSADMSLRQHLSSTARLAPERCSQAAFLLVCLPHEALFSLDAFGRTVWRMLVSHTRLLEWNPSANANRHGRSDLRDAFRLMWIEPVMCIAGAGILATANTAGPAARLAAGPILLLWLVSPFIIWRLSRPLPVQQATLSPDQLVFLRKLARKTWAFFETFVGPEDNWLPPDNYQEHPVARVAHRTSPTNIGLSLLANLSAYDLGALTAGGFLERAEKTFQTLRSLERYRGHFFNWYDTRSLKALPPLYISSVDSGNLAGHLLTLRAGLAEFAAQPVIGKQLFTNLADTLGIALDSLMPGDWGRVFQSAEPPQLSRLRGHAAAIALHPPATLDAARLCLEQMRAEAAEVFAALDAEENTSENQFRWWLHAFARQCRAALDELELLCPWAKLPPASLRSEAFPERDTIPNLRDLEAPADKQGVPWRLMEAASLQARARLERIADLQEQCGLFSRMEYDFLYNEDRRLLSIGYSVDEHRPDAGHYDLLASESRLASFVAIAQGALPQANWFALGRLLTNSGGEPILLSWSGSMFEYLMPLLVMPSYAHTLLDETCKTAVSRQIAYGKLRGVPWGISECGYNAFDASFNYQYRAFGVPDLGLKRGLAADLVMAPYASALALLVAPGEACLNLERLAAEGFASRYGMYEAVDYTPSRLPRGQKHGLIRSFMAHHQGMSLLALSHALLDGPMRKRFAADPQFQASMLLLQERVPKVTASYAHTNARLEFKRDSGVQQTPLRIFDNPNTSHPEVQLLSNGNYHVMITHAGGGYSRWRDMAITRWREDNTRDNWGMFCYIKDLTGGGFWSTTYQPLCGAPASFQAVFSEGRAEFSRRFSDYDVHTEIVVSSEDDIELRRVRITNKSRKRYTLEVTSFAEVVLAPPAVDDLHPAFSKLFVQTEIIPEREAILCTRRPRSQTEKTPWMLHTMTVHGAGVDAISYETDRREFLGRGRDASAPQAMDYAGNDSGALSGREGSVLDPIVAIRTRITLDAEHPAIIDIVTGIGETREAAVNLVNKYHDRHIADRVLAMAWTHGQVLLRQLNASEADTQLYARLAGSIIYANASLRAGENILTKNRRGQSGLWGYAISGDLPIVLLKIEDPQNIDLVRQLLQAHEYWRLKGLTVDLVIWNEDQVGYRQILHDQIMGLITTGSGANLLDRPGGIFVRAADRIADEDRILIQTVARVILSDAKGALSKQAEGARWKAVDGPLLLTSPRLTTALPEPAPQPRHDLAFFNGLGGFTPDGREYVITTAAGTAETPKQVTPAPWVNVLANPYFGTIISENGPVCTWSENAHEFRLTPWDNDLVNDSWGEAFYLRDEEQGVFWSPTPLPRRGTTAYVTRHGFGYSVFEHTENGIYSELQVYVALDGAIKFTSLKARNVSGRVRRLSATGYVEWVLGDLRTKSGMHVVTKVDADSGAILAYNPYNTEFPNRTAFFTVDDASRRVSGDRTEFIGRNGSLAAPAAMLRARLSGRIGAALDPCAAIQVAFELHDGQEREIIFKLGAGHNPEDAKNLIRRFAGDDAARKALEQVWRHWAHTLGAIHVETPDKSFDMLVNGWLLYQTLACRFWGRGAMYQSGGAFGFRDQLQDAMALIHARPDLVREHVLLCAAHQFPEGDVQHWWHPPLNRGVRTLCSDDYLWLPLAVCRYVLATGDAGVLDESAHFIQGRALKAEEESYYDLFGQTEESANLYEHCVRAIKHGLRFGAHGLPLMGSGDWNDGMNLVGIKGRGESVWLAFFLHEALKNFSELAAKRDDAPFAERCLAEAATLQRNIADHAWDGAWYRRAYFDDGSPLGSAVNPECGIDSIAQSWSVLSGAGEPERARKAMESLDKYLVDRDNRLVRLFAPPFDTSPLDPGYIKGYAPGVRENGGQYTHAAIWAAMAFARLGEKQTAWEILDIINPISHARSPEEIAVYKVEPYVMAADVYAAPLHIGRGGWTWYTGSAAWMYRFMTESLLGLTLENNTLRFTPCVPSQWESCKIHYRYRETTYHITLTQNPVKTGTPRVSVDGCAQNDSSVSLVDDMREHWVDVNMV